MRSDFIGRGWSFGHILKEHLVDEHTACVVVQTPNVFGTANVAVHNVGGSVCAGGPNASFCLGF